MRELLSVLLALALVSCSKISQSDMQGDWAVDSIQQQEVTADTDSGWKPQTAVSSIFIVGETLTFNKSTIIPCPSAISFVKDYDNYPGYVNYSLSGNRLVIPEQHYYYARIEDDGTGSAGESTFMALEFEVGITGNEMDLIGKFASAMSKGGLM